MALSIAQLDQGPAPGEDATVDRVAAAAFEMFAEYGIRRATIDDVARRAGVSKMTVFRRFQSKQGLVGVVIAREIRRGMAELDRVWEREQTLEQRVVLGFSFAVNFVRGHALFDRLLRSEPELLLPLLTIDGTAALALYRELIGQRLRTEVRAGRAAPADVDQAAEVLARLAISLLLTREGTITLDDDETIVALVRNVLLPMLEPRDG
ncbi:MAG TPA: TetR/AcrR family transcriptional regulator [Solirubrobacteraceae bacterium]|jgi:AcrR family transcriptional regulator|nr:TetR/AcrR family transcriptional regulator [Solirubrobacteraceae bacterium]